MQTTCSEFITTLASKSPTPGGGGAAAYVGAIGTALGNMVGSLTLGKKRYASVQDDITALKAKADTLQDALLTLIARDAEVFGPLAKAYGLPKETDEQKAEKARVMESALKLAASVPLEIMEKCCEAIDLHEAFAEKGTKIAISDVGCGVVCCKAALQSASLNVFINTKSMTDRAHAESVNEKAAQMLTKYEAKADQIYKNVLSQFK